MDWSTIAIRNGHLLIPQPGGGNLYFIAIPLRLILLVVMALTGLVGLVMAMSTKRRGEIPN